jgi:endo-1,4-beta-xylanase
MHRAVHPQIKFSRRVFMQLLAATFAVACTPIKFDANANQGEGLGLIAARKGKTFGAAIQSAKLGDTSYTAPFQRECALLVPESELKWEALRPNEATFDFSGYDRIKEFAVANNMRLRGHTLVWHHSNPAWLEEKLAGKSRADTLLKTHIQRVIAHTSPFIKQWDVVNEAISPHSTRPDGLRESAWLKALGPSYIPLAFEAAHEADKKLELVYNDYGLEYGDGNGFYRRKHTLKLLENLRKKKVPVHAFGLQSHLKTHIPLGGKAFGNFLSEIRAMGLKVYVTELDLDTDKTPGSAEDKITAGQNYLSAYLDLVQEHAKLDTLLTWGLSDRHSWLNEYNEDPAGMLPLDADNNRTPMWEMLRRKWAANLNRFIGSF